MSMQEKKMLSSERISQILEDLHIQISSVKCEVYEAIRAFYSQETSRSLDDALSFASTWSLKSKEGNNSGGIQHRMKLLEDRLSETVSHFQNDESDVHWQLMQSIADYKRLTGQIESSKAILLVLRVLSVLDEKLNTFDESNQKNDFVNAATIILSMENQLENLVPSTQEEDPSNKKILNLIQRQILKRKNHLICRVQGFLQNMVVLRDEGQILSIQKQIIEPDDISQKTIYLTDLIRALDILQTLSTWIHEHLLPLLHQGILRDILSPFSSPRQLDQSNITTSSSLSLSSSLDSNVVTVLQYQCFLTKKNSNNNHEDSIITLYEGYERILGFLQFLSSSLSTLPKEILLGLGKALWSGNEGISLQLIHLLQHAIPDKSNLLLEFQDLQLKMYNEFEKKLQALDLIDLQSDPSLKLFIDDLQRKFEEKKRTSLLSQVRKLLRGEYNNDRLLNNMGGFSSKGSSGSSSQVMATVTTDQLHPKLHNVDSTLTTFGLQTNSSFGLPCSRITECAFQLIQLAYHAMQEACHSNESCANVLYHTTRDMLDLFRAMIPVLHAQKIQKDTRTSMLFHNDCLFIAHHLLTMGHQFRNSLPLNLKRTATMVDMVPSFRRAGEDALVKYAYKQCDHLLNVVNHLPSLGLVDEEGNCNKVEEAFKNVLNHCRQLANVWKTGLTVDVFNKMLGLLWKAVIQQILDDLFSLAVIPANSARQLNYLFSLLLQVESYFDSPQTAEKNIINLSLFKIVTALLDESLNHISERCKRGDFQPFNSIDITRLLRALFQDSPKRADVLRAIEIQCN